MIPGGGVRITDREPHIFKDYKNYLIFIKKYNIINIEKDTYSIIFIRYAKPVVVGSNPTLEDT